MATKTLYLTSGVASGAAHHALQDGGTAPSSATMVTGWTTGTTVADRYSRMSAGVERAATTFTSTVQPNGAPDNTLGDCFRSPLPLTGVFAAGNWTYSFPIIASASSSKTGRIRVRLWGSSNATGSSATEIGSARALSVANADDVEAISSGTVSEPSVTLTNQYLFVQVAWHIVTDSSSSTSDVLLRTGSAGSVTTTNLAVPQTLAVGRASETDTARGWIRPLAFSARVGGAWVASTVKVRNAGAWTDVGRFVHESGTWN